MKTKILNYEIESKYLGNKNWDHKLKNKNNHNIRVTNIDTNNSATFEFWESVNSVMIKTEEQLLYAFRCFLQDAEAGEMDIDEFQDNFGYEKASELIKVYKACQESSEKASNLDIDYYKLFDLLYEMGIE